ncbi:MAG: type II toxin-antitoxin system VapC family toxin [Saprospiraceae bacterium]|nr:type II toxin-antitoxin system VapC family toxin [Saprospiraceae bacterium]
MERYLLDTSAVIKYLNESFPEKALSFLDQILDQESNISFITQIELLVWNPPNPNDFEIYQTFVENSNVLQVNNEIIEHCIAIRKTTKIKVPDALIAASAVTFDMTLVSDNDKDFNKVVEMDIGLQYLNPKKI